MKILLAVCMILVFGKLSDCRPRYDTFADMYSSMGDIDWGKRSGYDNWISPAWGYSSMADTDWGWKKRSDDFSDDEDGETEDSEIEKRSSSKLNSYYTPYRYRQPYTLASSSYMPYKPHRSLDEPQSSLNVAAVTDPQPKSVIRNTRSHFGDRTYNYVSMADADWGWKRKRSADEGKRNLASLARENGLPSKFRSRRVDTSLEKDSLASLAGHYDLINDLDLHRAARSGISSLARNGALRHHPQL